MSSSFLFCNKNLKHKFDYSHFILFELLITMERQMEKCFYCTILHVQFAKSGFFSVHSHRQPVAQKVYRMSLFTLHKALLKCIQKMFFVCIYKDKEKVEIRGRMAQIGWLVGRKTSRMVASVLTNFHCFMYIMYTDTINIFNSNNVLEKRFSIVYNLYLSVYSTRRML